MERHREGSLRRWRPAGASGACLPHVDMSTVGHFAVQSFANAFLIQIDAVLVKRPNLGRYGVHDPTTTALIDPST